ncbi:MAG: prephenate dehydrogenase [Methanosarcinales archaeon]|jgi:prephenate dehydrogenase|nr:prephenate dehydrogenase [Methanosarcinales archaeon]
MKQKIGFIGLGLIGGSVAKAVRQYYPDAEIIAFDKSEEMLAPAVRESVIDTACAGVDDNFSGCDYIFLCTPVSSNNAYLTRLKPYLHENCILTDVGSVKTPIHEEIKALGMEENFIGGHPMAGSEKTGYAHSKAMLIENAYYILTPTEKVSSDKIEKLSSFIESLKAIPIELDYGRHDYITGTISHLPHLLAAGLVNYVKENDSKDELMKLLAAGGFKDMTRIASSSPVMWQQICLENSKNITEILEKYIALLEQTKKQIETKNSQELYDMFDSSKNYRNSIPDASAGPIKKGFALYCDIADEAGGIAAIAAVLAGGGVNIKNIGIIHNREFEEGVLRIEFYEEKAADEAARLLQKHKYTVYER